MDKLEAVRQAFRHNEFPVFTTAGDYSTCDFDAEGSIATLTRLGYTIVPIDPEAQAVAELLAMERAEKLMLCRYEAGTAHWVVMLYSTGWPKGRPMQRDTAVELLAAVQKALKEATDAP